MPELRRLLRGLQLLRRLRRGLLLLRGVLRLRLLRAHRLTSGHFSSGGEISDVSIADAEVPHFFRMRS